MIRSFSMSIPNFLKYYPWLARSGITMNFQLTLCKQLNNWAVEILIDPSGINIIFGKTNEKVGHNTFDRMNEVSTRYIDGQYLRVGEPKMWHINRKKSKWHLDQLAIPLLNSLLHSINEQPVVGFMNTKRFGPESEAIWYLGGTIIYLLVHPILFSDWDLPTLLILTSFYWQDYTNFWKAALSTWFLVKFCISWSYRIMKKFIYKML